MSTTRVLAYPPAIVDGAEEQLKHSPSDVVA